MLFTSYIQLVESPHSTLYIPHFTLYILRSTLYTPHLKLYTVHSSLHTIHSTLYTPHSTLYTLHSTLFRIPQSTVHWYGNGENVDCSNYLFHNSVRCDCIRVRGLHLALSSLLCAKKLGAVGAAWTFISDGGGDLKVGLLWGLGRIGILPRGQRRLLTLLLCPLHVPIHAVSIHLHRRQ